MARVAKPRLQKTLVGNGSLRKLHRAPQHSYLLGSNQGCRLRFSRRLRQQTLKADARSLSISKYLRRLGLALPVESTIAQRAILDLAKINADLGRLDGLIKMWLTSDADFESLNAQGFQRKLENTLTPRLLSVCGRARL